MRVVHLWRQTADGWVCVEDVSGETVVTDSEKAADQMRQDILGGKIDRAGRQVVRKAIDHMDAPPSGAAKSDGALGSISKRGGW